jgi:rhodanese-related sulfurtransferase
VAAERIDPRTAFEMQRAGDTIVDVRTPAEFADGHIPGAINIPIDMLALHRLPPGAIITTCSMGGRGGRAADMLARAGRTAFSLRGGVKAWAAAGLPVVKSSERRRSLFGRTVGWQRDV